VLSYYPRCGEGNLVIMAAQQSIYSVGIDIDPVLIETCKKKAVDLGLQDMCEFYVADLMVIDLDRFQFISCYLYQPTLNMVSERLSERVLKGGCMLASVLYRPIGWTAIKEDSMYKIYLYDHTCRTIV
jgi:ubiquinone/menaquinone biosynthesis C-methylase UbiE